ncbi:hypothetical protein [Streptomyces guryensis]|uniref:Uncharacterized protein n=1 Tax=Streptomyces guryensis TaxID=2886947 RepID=A0A9Q3VSB6_9ACTN|nr:hypothetical protein [Streptomyces guryensis]MCD9876085.1 hypothetical protein [Streptomyces guryensis]
MTRPGSPRLRRVSAASRVVGADCGANSPGRQRRQPSQPSQPRERRGSRVLFAVAPVAPVVGTTAAIRLMPYVSSSDDGAHAAPSVSASVAARVTPSESTSASVRPAPVRVSLQPLVR